MSAYTTAHELPYTSARSEAFPSSSGPPPEARTRAFVHESSHESPETHPSASQYSLQNPESGTPDLGIRRIRSDPEAFS